ncbi:hypothetical protein BV22DRAFT_1132340 [Leucogyrophana mollusca]|uniref:Uncharacterized protein n=1 Tax=Leucogyrophana mollusca TaxID=85980 RepID=A0ACB8B710_9AGAM|nr:hypothetical protein BV22DRAFT_1132340 [Leucogyrophana mollusca]
MSTPSESGPAGVQKAHELEKRSYDDLPYGARKKAKIGGEQDLQEGLHQEREFEGQNQPRLRAEMEALNLAAAQPVQGGRDVTAGLALDLVEGVRGVQVNKNADVITWPGGVQTVAPYLPRSSKSDTENYLSRDESWVRRLARYPASRPGSNHVVYMANLSDQGALSRVRDSLSQGKVVVVKDFAADSVRGFEFTEKGVHERFGFSPNMPLTMHDARKRVTKPGYPHVPGNFATLIGGINNVGECRFVLDVPMAHIAAPAPLDLLDDGLAVGFSQTTTQYSLEGKSVSSDVHSARSWGLAHQAAVMTYTHHDADGAGTYIIVLSGAKFWTVVFEKDPKRRHGDMRKTAPTITNMDCLGEYDEAVYEVETIYAFPGDLIIQGPNQWHAAYTPVKSFSRGGHFYSYDTMHLTEVSRFIDHTESVFTTNQEHGHCLETLSRMVLALPCLVGFRKFYRRPLLALCVMVLSPDEYVVTAQANKPTSHYREEAEKISQAVLRRLGASCTSQAIRELRQREHGFAERGPEVVLGDCLDCYKPPLGKSV